MFQELPRVVVVGILLGSFPLLEEEKDADVDAMINGMTLLALMVGQQWMRCCRNRMSDT